MIFLFGVCMSASFLYTWLTSPFKIQHKTLVHNFQSVFSLSHGPQSISSLLTLQIHAGINGRIFCSFLTVQLLLGIQRSFVLQLVSFSKETNFNTSYLHYKQPETFLHQISNQAFFKNPKKQSVAQLAKIFKFSQYLFSRKFS